MTKSSDFARKAPLKEDKEKEKKRKKKHFWSEMFEARKEMPEK